MPITSEQFDLFFLPFEKSFVCLLLDLLDIRIGYIIDRWNPGRISSKSLLSGYLRENLIGNEIRNAGKCCQNGQIGYRTGTQHNQKNKNRRTCIHPFCQYHQSRDRGHEQADDNDYRQQNHITVDLTELHCANSVVSVSHCYPKPATDE